MLHCCQAKLFFFSCSSVLICRTTAPFCTVFLLLTFVFVRTRIASLASLSTRALQLHLLRLSPSSFIKSVPEKKKKKKRDASRCCCRSYHSICWDKSTYAFFFFLGSFDALTDSLSLSPFFFMTVLLLMATLSWDSDAAKKEHVCMRVYSMPICSSGFCRRELLVRDEARLITVYRHL